MLKNKLYVYGSREVVVPCRLQVGEYLLKRMINSSHKVALINGATKEESTYGQLAQEAMNLAISFSHLGLRKGETVAICSENRAEYFGVVLATACVGAVLTPINPGYVEGEIRHVMKLSKPKFIFCSPAVYKQIGNILQSLKHIEKIILFGDMRNNDTLLYRDLVTPISNKNDGEYHVHNRLIRDVDPKDFEAVEVDGQSDTAFILYSSGTTGLPKGVMLTHMNVLALCCLPTSVDVKIVPLTITPWFHTMGLMSMLVSFCAQRTVVYLPKFEVELYLKTIETYKIQQLTVVPPIIVALCKSKGQYDLGSVELVYSGAAPLHKETADLLKTRFPNVKAVLQAYGMTETTLFVTRDIYDNRPTDPGSVGGVVDGAVVKVVDIQTRQPLGPNQEGEICIKSPTVMKGYLGKEKGDDFDEEGFLKTGDIGYYDGDRKFFIVDRLKELIKYKGYQVSPTELEVLLLQHEAVRDAGVVGIPDHAAGELPLAFVVKQPGATVTEKELKQLVATNLSNPKHLRGGVRFVNAIPRTASGKILRKDLRKMAKNSKSKL